MNIIKKRIIINEFELLELLDKTKDQSANSLWHEVRSYQISASIKLNLVIY